ncbi:MAG TPA: FecR family protein [Allosphingosinicella sp.]
MATLPSLAAAQEVIGINAAVRNLVQIRTGSAPARHAVLRQPVRLNDEVRTGPASQLQILFRDRSSFTVGANSRIRIDRFAYDAPRSVREFGGSVTRGAFRFISGRSFAMAPGSRSLRTPVATMGIRGTILEGVVGADAVRIAAAESAVGPDARSDPETATLILLRGPGPQAQGGVAAGAVEVAAGDKSFVLDQPLLALYVPGPGVPPIGPFRLSDAGILSVEQLVRPSPPAAARAAASEGPDQDRQAVRRSIPAWVAPLLAILAAGFVVLDDSDETPVSP